MKNILFLTLGFLFVGLGAIGAALPVLPTTPFLIVALLCFGKGSERWNQWFMETSIYKKYLESFYEKKGMTAKQKIGILLFADFMIAFPLILTDSIWVKTMLAVIVIIKYCYFIFAIKTIRPGQDPDPAFAEAGEEI